MIKFDVGADLYTIISSNVELPSDRTYPIVAREDTPTPFITYQRTSAEFVSNKDFTQLNQHTFEFDIVTNEYAEGVDLTEKLINTLLNYNYRALGIKSISVSSASEAFTDNKFVQTITIEVRI